MKKLLMCVLFLLGFSGYVLGIDHGTVSGHVNTLSSGDTITYLLATGSVGVMEDGSSISQMYGTDSGAPNSSVTTMNGGIIAYMHNKTSVYEMYGGTITTIAGTADRLSGSYLTNMHNGYVGLLSNGSYITNMYNGTINSMSNNGTVRNLESGTINQMSGNSQVENMTGGTIGNMQGAARVEEMTAGTVADMAGSSYINKLDGGSVTAMSGNSYITTFESGAVDSMSGASKIVTMNDGLVTAMNEGSSITTMNGGIVTDMNDWSSINLLTDGTVKNVNGATIVKMDGADAVIENMTGVAKIYNAGQGTIKYMTDMTEVTSLEDGAVIELMEGTSKVEHVTGSTIDIMQGNSTAGTAYTGAAINSMKGNASIGTVYEGAAVGTMENDSNIDLLQGGSVASMKGAAVVTRFDGGTISAMSEFANVDILANGTISSMKDSSIVNSMTWGVITKMEDDSKVTGISGGTISEMTGNASVDTLSGNGVISRINSTSNIIDNMTGGTITEMNNGTVTAMSGGTISEMKGNATVGTLSGTGTINEITEGSVIDIMNGGTVGTLNAIVNTMNGGEIHNMDYGLVGNVSAGTIHDVKGTSQVGTLKGTGIITSLSGDALLDLIDGGTLVHFSDDAEVTDFNSGEITNMYGGKVGNISAAGVIKNIYAGTIFGDVTNGADLNITDLGRVTLDDGGFGATFDAEINTGEQTLIIAKSYDFGTNSVFNIGDRGTVTMGEITLDKVNFLGTGTMNMESFTGNTHGNATIKEFSAADKVTFDFYLDFEHNGNNDYLVIESNTGTENEHYINVANAPPSFKMPRSKIDLIEDQSGSMDFTLANGKMIGLGARTYSLASESLGVSNQWYLGLARGLSDGANAIGSMPTANLMSIHSLQETLTQRMGDIRNYSAKGLWTRVYTNQTKFDNLTETEISNYGMEVGYDMEIAEFESSRIMLGIGGGTNYADIFIKAKNSRDGGGNTTMPYGGLYATWLTDSGFYVDVVARYAYNDTEGYYYSNMNEKETFDIYGHSGLASFEAGKQFYVTEKLILEPRAKFDYVYMTGGDSFEDKAGFRADYGDTRSLLGGAGLVVRYDIGKVKPYAKVTYLYEFDGKTDVRYDNVSYESDVNGWRAAGVAGFSYDISRSFILFGEAGYQGGEKSYQNINGNLGIRYAFGKANAKKEEPAAVEEEEEIAEEPEPEVVEEEPAAEPEPVVEEPKEAVKPVTAPIKEEKVEKIEVGKTVKVSGGNFVAGKATVGPKTEASVRESARELKSNDFSKIIITGHSDSTGSKALNDRLSLQRAQTVANIITQEGIEKEKIETIGKGSSEPSATNATAAGRAENRRVEIEVIQ